MTENLGAARSPDTFGVFKDHETNWVFKRTLEQMSEKAAEIGECLYVASQIDETDLESWIREWASLAQRVEALAHESLEKGNQISAREGFLRASNYYRTAEYGTPPSHPRHFELWDKSVKAFNQVGKLFDPPIQRINIDFEGHTLPGYFLRPDNSDTPRPTIIGIGGNDSSGEEMVIDMGFGAVRRGYNFFTFEYPGHRGAVHLDPTCIKRPDMEVPFKVAIDFLETLPGVDDRIALGGFSFGGYVASRVGCYEPRIKALIPDSPVIDLPEVNLVIWAPILKSVPKDQLHAVVRQQLKKSPLQEALHDYSMWTFGQPDMVVPEWIETGVGDAYNIRNQLKNITCPTLALVSKDEGEVLVRQAHQFYEGIASETKEIHVFTKEYDGSNDHCQLDNFARAHQVTFDWLNKVFDYQYPTN